MTELVELFVLPLEQAASAAASELRAALDTAARTAYEETLARNARIRAIAIAGILCGCWRWCWRGTCSSAASSIR